MKKKKAVGPSVQFGTSLMLVVFMVLCLTAFAVLSLSSALRDYKYSEKSAQKTAEYYQADTTARHKMAELEQVLRQISADNPDTYKEQALRQLKELGDVTVSGGEEQTPVRVSWQVKMNERQALKVELTLGGPEEKLYEISCWKEISTQKWNPQTTLPVIGSED